MQQKWLFVITPKTKLIDLNLKEVGSRKIFYSIKYDTLNILDFHGNIFIR